MQPIPSTDFAAILLATETALNVQYPPTAVQLFAELSAIVGTSKCHGIFEKARLLITADEVSEPQFEVGGPLVDGYLLPFMRDGDGEFPCIYGFDMADLPHDRIAVYSVHTIVESWASAAAFVHWVHAFVPQNRPPL